MSEISSSRRRRQRLRKRVFVVGALVAVSFALFMMSKKVGTLITHMHIAKAVSDGAVTTSGVKTEWNIEREMLTATLFLKNSSGSDISGNLLFEFTLRPDRLSGSYLEELFRRKPLEEKARFAARIESLESPRPRDMAILSYLKNGEKTAFAEFEPMLVEGSNQPSDLVFRLRTYAVHIGAGELTRAVVYQDLPAERFGEHLTADDVKLIGVEFD